MSAGEVLEVKVRAGELAQPGSVDPIVVLGDTSALTARIDIDERDVGALAIDAPMDIRAKAYPEEEKAREVIDFIDFLKTRRATTSSSEVDEPQRRQREALARLDHVRIDFGGSPMLDREAHVAAPHHIDRTHELEHDAFARVPERRRVAVGPFARHWPH
jgi:hypothetical protein